MGLLNNRVHATFLALFSLSVLSLFTVGCELGNDNADALDGTSSADTANTSGSTGEDTSGSTSGSTGEDTSGSTSGSTGEDTSGSTSGSTSGDTSGSTSGSTSGDTSGSTDTIDPPVGWVSSGHPCAGNRTDALWVDEDTGRVWVGCGTTTEGYGMYTSADGGTRWASLDALENWRINDIRRSADGLLYAAGTDTRGPGGVVSIDTNADPMVITVIWTQGNIVGTAFQVGNFARNAAGEAIAESLTGTDIAYRSSDSASWEYYDSAGWATGPQTDGYQILDLAMHNDEFYGAGSRISQPPMVFLPDLDHQLLAVRLSTAFTGEQWGVAVSDTGKVYTAGVNHDDHVGVIFSHQSGDPAQASTWLMFDVSDLHDRYSWMRGICARGERVVAVGELQPLTTNGGLVLESVDGGKTWSDISPDDSPDTISNCKIMPDGSLIVVGGGGYIATHR